MPPNFSGITSESLVMIVYWSRATNVAKSSTIKAGLLRIMEIDGENYFVTTINTAPKDGKRFAPFADIETKSKTLRWPSTTEFSPRFLTR